MIDLLKDLKIACRTTCGCGNPLVPYTKQTETTHYLLTCKAYSNDYDHPILIAIDKNSPIFVMIEKFKELREFHSGKGTSTQFSHADIFNELDIILGDMK